VQSVEDTILFGKYRIERVIGRGRSGTVFLARHLGLDERRAIKRVPREHADSAREAAVLKELRHPGIPIIYDLEEDSNYYYLIEEYLDGESLYALIQREGSLVKAKAVSYGIELCRIIIYLHSFEPNPILYLDLQPRNILICQGALKLIDFDQAVMFSDAKTLRTRYGTKGCAAPEQYTDEPLDERTDIYAIGVLLYFMGTGQFPGTGPADTECGSADAGCGSADAGCGSANAGCGSADAEYGPTGTVQPERIRKGTSEDAARRCGCMMRARIDEGWAEHWRRAEEGLGSGAAAVAMRCLNPEKEGRFQSAGEVLEALMQVRSGVFAENQMPFLKIAVVGSKAGMGVTHVSLGVISYLSGQGISCLYREQNDSGAVRKAADYREQVPDRYGIIHLDDWAMKPKYGRFVQLEQPDYDALVDDFGTGLQTVSEEDYDILFLVCGAGEWEMEDSKEAIRLLAQKKNLRIMFNHVSPDKKIILPGDITKLKFYRLPFFALKDGEEIMPRFWDACIKGTKGEQRIREWSGKERQNRKRRSVGWPFYQRLSEFFERKTARESLHIPRKRKRR